MKKGSENCHTPQSEIARYVDDKANYEAEVMRLATRIAESRRLGVNVNPADQARLRILDGVSDLMEQYSNAAGASTESERRAAPIIRELVERIPGLFVQEPKKRQNPLEKLIRRRR